MPPARCGVCGRLLMVTQPVPPAVRCALCDIACSHDAPRAPDDGDERQANDASS